MPQPLLHSNDIVVAFEQMQRDGVAIDVWGDVATAKRRAVLGRLAGKAFDPPPNAEPRQGLPLYVQKQVRRWIADCSRNSM